MMYQCPSDIIIMVLAEGRNLPLLKHGFDEHASHCKGRPSCTERLETEKSRLRRIRRFQIIGGILAIVALFLYSLYTGYTKRG